MHSTSSMSTSDAGSTAWCSRNTSSTDSRDSRPWSSQLGVWCGGVGWGVLCIGGYGYSCIIMRTPTQPTNQSSNPPPKQQPKTT